MKIICFYWQGDRWQQPDYTPVDGHKNLQKKFMKRAGTVSDNLPGRYINNLFNGIRRYAGRQVDFICFTNEELVGLDPEIETRQFPMVTQHGVLPRLFMFSRDAGLFGHQVLCLDIDIIIVGDLTDFLNYHGEFCARSKFKRGLEWKLDGDIMSFTAGAKAESVFWKPFIKDVDGAIEETSGRERYWIRKCIGEYADRWDQYAPNQVVSYKRHVAPTRRLPKDARIVSCHGVPRPHQIKDPWIRGYWI